MATTTTATTTAAVIQREMLVTWPDEATARDPFRFGWRYLRRERPDGTTEFEQVPLTLEDVLHPEEEDFIVQSDTHQRWCRYLADVLEAQIAPDPKAVVLSDCRIAWGVPGLRAHGADLAVVFGVSERKNWGTFDVAAEGVLPELVIEVASPTTVDIDRSTKLDHYAQAGVRFYVIIDGIAGGRRAAMRLLGYELVGDRYQPLPLDERGCLWLETVRVWLGSEGGEVVCYAERGEPLGDYRALAIARADAERRADEASAAQAVAEQRAEEEAVARVVAEQRADELATQLREMEAELRRLRGE